MVMEFLSLSGPHQSSIVKAWHHKNEKEVFRLLDSIDEGDRSSFNSTSDLTDILEQTSSPRMRAAVAIALIKIEAKDAEGSLLKVLRQPGIADVSGTLIYAINELGLSMPIDIATDIIKSGSFEGRGETLTLFEENRIDISDENELDLSLEKLEKLSSSSDVETSEAAKMAISYIEDNREPRLEHKL